MEPDVPLMEKKNILGASLVAQFKTPIQVESDLLAAARGLFKCEAGIACILGTGSNSCFYDGKIVVKNVKHYFCNRSVIIPCIGAAISKFHYRGRNGFLRLTSTATSELKKSPPRTLLPISPQVYTDSHAIV